MTHQATLNNARGLAFEELLDWLHNIYANNDRAEMRHNGYKAIKRRDGSATLVKSPVDYTGLLRGGQYVAFDAKVSSTRTYHHPKDRLHQLEQLWRVHRMGGLAFLFVCWDAPDTQDRRYFMVKPNPAWAIRKWHSIRLDTMQETEGVEVDASGGYGLPSWLDAVQGSPINMAIAKYIDEVSS